MPETRESSKDGSPKAGIEADARRLDHPGVRPRLVMTVTRRARAFGMVDEPRRSYGSSCGEFESPSDSRMRALSMHERVRRKANTRTCLSREHADVGT
jgi:hypothetical protein